MYPDICSDDVFHCDPGRHGHRGGTLGIWLCSILPASGTSIQASVLYAITDFQFLNLAGLSVWMPYAMIGACMIEIPLFAFLAVRSYCRHALN